MKRNCCLAILAMFCGLVFAATSPKELLDTYAEKKGLELYDFIEGNYTDSGKQEVLGFFRYAGKEQVEKVICFVYDKKIRKEYEIPFNHLLNTSVDVSDTNWGNQRAYGWTGDFNDTGKDQIFIYALETLFFAPFGYEFFDGEFKLVLDVLKDREPWDEILDTVGVITKKRKNIVIDEYNRPFNVHCAATYIWNDKLKIYQNQNLDVPYVFSPDYNIILRKKIKAEDGNTYLWNTKTHRMDIVEE